MHEHNQSCEVDNLHGYKSDSKWPLWAVNGILGIISYNVLLQRKDPHADHVTEKNIYVAEYWAWIECEQMEVDIMYKNGVTFFIIFWTVVELDNTEHSTITVIKSPQPQKTWNFWGYFKILLIITVMWCQECCGGDPIHSFSEMQCHIGGFVINQICRAYFALYSLLIVRNVVVVSPIYWFSEVQCHMEAL